MNTARNLDLFVMGATLMRPGDLVTYSMQPSIVPFFRPTALFFGSPECFDLIVREIRFANFSWLSEPKRAIEVHGKRIEGAGAVSPMQLIRLTLFNSTDHDIDVKDTRFSEVAW